MIHPTFLAWLRRLDATFLAFAPDLLDKMIDEETMPAGRVTDWLLAAEASLWIERGSNPCFDHPLYLSVRELAVHPSERGYKKKDLRSPLLFGYSPLPGLKIALSKVDNSIHMESL